MDQKNSIAEMSNWREIKNYLLYSKQCENVHKMVWDGVAYVTLRTGRIEVTGKTSLEELKEKIKKENFV